MLNEDFPPEVKPLLDRFGDAHTEWSTSEGADNFCGVAAGEFMEFIEAETAWTVREVHFHQRGRWERERLAAGRIDSGWTDIVPCLPYSAGPSVYHGGLASALGHIVVEIKELGICVDWTARQFKETAPFPLVFPSPFAP